MSVGSSIEWTDATWNVVRGCSRVSAGCDSCYAIPQAHRFSGPGGAYEGLTRIGARGVDWSGSARLIRDKLAEPLSWRKPRRVFVNSMSDLFHESLSFHEIAAVFGIMGVARKHTFQVLTKRPKRAAEFFAWLAGQPEKDADLTCQRAARAAMIDSDAFPLHPIKGTHQKWPWPYLNIWLGVSGENQKTVDDRASALLELPAAVRFISLEPLLEEVSIWAFFKTAERDRCLAALGGNPSMPGLDWVIVGGESGNGARHFDLSWAAGVVRQCERAQVACFVKQLGSRPISDRVIYGLPFAGQPVVEGLMLVDRSGGDMSEWPAPLRVREFPRGG